MLQNVIKLLTSRKGRRSVVLFAAIIVHCIVSFKPMSKGLIAMNGMESDFHNNRSAITERNVENSSLVRTASSLSTEGTAEERLQFHVTATTDYAINTTGSPPGAPNDTVRTAAAGKDTTVAEEGGGGGWETRGHEELDARPQISALTRCWLDIEREYVPLIYELNQQCKPMLHAVKIIHDVFYVLFSTSDLLGPWRAEWNEGQYACNGVSNSTKLSSHGSGIVLECPRSINASHTVLASVSVTAPSTAACSGVGRDSENNDATTTTTDVVVVTYNTTIFDECEREDIRYHEGLLGNNNRTAIKIGIHAVFVGDRQKAFEWAAYHHLIGFDHVWMYVNDDWNGGKGLVYKDYITWIPFNFRIRNYPYNRKRGENPKNVFRIAGMNDGLWRAKRMGLDWFAAMDFDEYIRIDSPSSSIFAFHSSLKAFGPGLSASHISTLPKFLNTFQKRMGEKYDGIRMNSIFFGRGPDENKTKTERKLDIDYGWRKKGDPGKFHFARFKLILNVSCTEFIKIHWYQKGKSCPGEEVLWNSNANDLRFNHYKMPSNGVFRKDPNHVHPPQNVERDTSLIDEYREKLIKEIRSTDFLDLETLHLS